MNKKFFVLTTLFVLTLCLSFSAHAVANVSVGNDTTDLLFWNSYWNSVSKSLISGMIDLPPASSAVISAAVSATTDFVSIQSNNGNGNYSKQIGMDTVLFESQRMLYLQRINSMWGKYVILMYLVKEIFTLAFYATMLWLLLYFFFVAVPTLFLRIADSMKDFIQGGKT